MNTVTYLGSAASGEPVALSAYKHSSKYKKIN